MFQVVVLHCCWYGTSYLCISKANIGHILTYNAYRRVRDIVNSTDETLTPKNNLEGKEGKIKTCKIIILITYISCTELVKALLAGHCIFFCSFFKYLSKKDTTASNVLCRFSFSLQVVLIER